MRRWHWAIFVVISVLLGFLVFYTILHMIDTTTSMARRRACTVASRDGACPSADA